MSFRDKLNSSKFSELGSDRKFEHSWLNVPKLERIDAPDGRRYITPAGNAYPSVTTIIGNVEDKSWLDDWKRRVGEIEASRITARSARRGTELHKICERYLLNESGYLGNPTPVYYGLFKQVKPKIDEYVGRVFGIEIGLYSDYLKAAGTADVVAEWDGLSSIVDWKNARYKKKLEDIEGYFIQTGIYAIMVEELTGMIVPQLTVVMAVEGEKEALVFTQKRKDWDNKVLNLIGAYYAKNPVVAAE